MEEIGEVVKLKNNMAVVRLRRSAACERCGACRLVAADFMEADARNSIKAKKGDRVLIELEPRTLLTASFIVYIVPLIFLILGYFVGAWLASFIARANLAEIFAVILGFAFFAFSYLIIREIDRRLASSEQFYPVVKKIIE